jgi:ABC-type multidrug transport system ATPase subunit
MNIVAHQLGKRYNREWIIKDFSYHFQSQKTYAIVGPNGSGKSTLLQVLWGQLPKSTGELTYSVKELPLLPEVVFKNISIATPYMDLIDEFTLEEMVRFHFEFKKIRDQKPIEELIELSGLQASSQKQLINFSSGMRQRLKLLLAFWTQAECLFLDEPTTNLDRKSVDWYWENLTKIVGKTTVVIASNIDNEYPVEADKIDILDFK